MSNGPDRDRLLRLAAALVCLLCTEAAAAQDLSEERSHVLRVMGSVRELDVNLFPTARAAGVAARQPVIAPQADSLRLHFRLLDAEPAREDWVIRLRQGDELRWSFTAKDLVGGGIWSDEIPGDGVLVELVSEVPDNPVRIRIDLVAATRPLPAPLSISGDNQLTPIAHHDSWVQALGRSVARLRFVGDDRRIYTCTGFLISRELLLTNQHCISSDPELHSALVDFDFDTDVAETTFTRLRERLSDDHGLDYSVVRLASPVGDREPLRFSEAGIGADEALLIIQHPGGEPKQVSVEDCRVDEALVTGRGGSASDFAHLCDTLGGSSGSPVISMRTRLVVGLHHLGFDDEDADLFNRAVHIGRVRAHLPADLVTELGAAAPVSP